MTPVVVRTVVVLGVAGTLIGAAAGAPLVLRRLSSFNVRVVEVVGARHLAADAAIAASGITRRSNVFEDPAAWRAALLRHPMVADARIQRRVPHTILLHIAESVPVAFARTPELRAIDERGRVLPLNPAYDDMDLPVLVVATRMSASGTASDEPTRRIAAFLSHVMRAEPGLIGWISEVDVHGAAIRLVLRTATDADVLVPALPSGARLTELHLTLTDLATPRLAAAADTAATMPMTELSRVRRIDVRFHDQIVVALHGESS